MRDVWVLSNDLFIRLLEKLDEHSVDYEMYIGVVVTDNDRFISVCVEVNGKNYCKDRVR
mgnify:CR=1 FL=1